MRRRPQLVAAAVMVSAFVAATTSANAAAPVPAAPAASAAGSAATYAHHVTLGILAGSSVNHATQPASLPASPARVGNDISWPQCPVNGEGAMPMPLADSAFTIVGLTNGLPFTDNPCFKEQIDWLRAASRKMPFQVYTMAAYPTAEQLAKYRNAGPENPASMRAALRNVGRAEATYALEYMKKNGVSRTSRIWIDVETRTKQPWPGDAANNRAVLEGMLATFAEQKVSAGFYSSARDWKLITGNWQRPDIPFWVTSGPRGKATAAKLCGTKAYNGGPVIVSQWWDTKRDWNLSCAASPVT